MISWLAKKINRKFAKNIADSKQEIYLMFSFLFLFFAISTIVVISLIPSGNVVDIARAGGTANWIGASGGTWNIGSNWDIGTVPTSTTIVNISSSTAITVNVNSDISFDTLNIGGSSAANTLVLTADITEGVDININNNGAIRQKNTNTQTITGDLTINSGGTLTHSDNSTSHAYEVDFSTVNITVNSGGIIDVDGLGFEGGLNNFDSGEGPGGGDRYAAGGHCGNGGDGLYAGYYGGQGYGDITNVITLGSGAGAVGSNSDDGGDGGGLIRLNASGTITIDGTITADGTIGQVSNASGGAGGGVNLTAATITGTPDSFSVTGANSAANGAGGGGGCVYMGANNPSIAYTSVNMAGGISVNQEEGGAGMLLIKDTDSGGNGDLYLVNMGSTSEDSVHGVTSLTVDSITLDSNATFTVSSTQTLILPGASNDPFAAGDATGIIYISPGATITPNATFGISSSTFKLEQGATLNNASTININNNGVLEMRSYATSTAALSVTTLNINDGGTLTHTDNSSAQNHIINVSATTVNVNSGGSIDVDYKGYSGGLVNNQDGFGPGGGLDLGGGGGHAGVGGNGPFGASGGTTYCTTSSPDTIGSGGGAPNSNNDDAGDGGGLVYMTVAGVFTLNGTITADGGADHASGGGGSGGGINLTANSFAGTPASFTAVGAGPSNNGGGGGGGCVLVSHTAANTIGSATVTGGDSVNGNDGSVGFFLANSLNTAPTATAISPYQSSSSIVIVTTTVSDADSNITNLTLEYSLDNVTWATSTLGTVTPSSGSVDKFNGSIEGIDTDTADIALTIEWNLEADIPETDDTTVYFRLTPNDGVQDGSTQTSAAFAVDTKAPTAPGDLTTNTITNSSVILSFGATTTDSNFSEYKIFYKEGSAGVEVTDTAHTSSTDSNLGNVLYGGATTTTISGLSANTQYVTNIVAYDSWGNATGATEINFYTLASTPSSVSATADSTSQITVSWSGDGTQYYVENITAGTNSGWISASSYAFTGLDAGTSYSFRIKGKNAEGTETGWSSNVSATTQSAGGGAPPGGGDGGGGDPENPDCVGEECAEDEPEGTVSGYVFIAEDEPIITSTLATAILIFTPETSEYAITEAEDGVCDYSGESFTSIEGEVKFDLNYDYKNIEFEFSPEPGDKKICVKYRGLIGDSYHTYNVFDDVEYAPPVPSGKVTINNGDVETTDNKVLLKTYDIENADYFAYSTGTTFPTLGVPVGSSWLVYVTFPEGEYGEKTITVRLKNEFGDTFLSDTINYVASPTEGESEPEEDEEEPEPSNDVDGDGVIDELDNCILEPNSDQADSNGNGIGDVCDPCPGEENDCQPPYGEVTINSGAEYTKSQTVSLQTTNMQNVNKFAYSLTGYFSPTQGIAMDKSNFSVAVTLPSGDGVKSLFVKLSNDFGSIILQDSIILDSSPEPEEEEEVPDEEDEEQDEDEEEQEEPETGEPTEDDATTDTEDEGPTGPDVGDGEAPSAGDGPTIFVKGVVKNINDQASNIAKGIQNILSDVFAPVTIVISNGVEVVQKVIDNPQVEAINEKAVAPAVATVGAANIAASVAVGGFQLPQVVAFLRYLFTQPFLLLRLRKRKDWGVVYNSFTKQPVDLATIRLIDTHTNRVVSSQVTDSRGRFLLIASAGTYKLEISKPGFGGFSEYLMDKKEDSKYINLYHGKEINIKEPKAINYNIPIDPIDKELSTIKILKDHAIKTTQNIIALSGLVITITSFVISPTAIIAAFFFLHLLFYSMFYRFSHVDLPAAWGKVVEKLSQKPIGRVVVRVFDSAYDKLVETGITDRKGRYAILVGPSRYYATYEKPGFKEKKTAELDYSSEKTQGMGGILNVSEELEKKNEEKKKDDSSSEK